MDFETDEVCKEAKKAMEDCQIDGCNVSVAYARAKVERNPSAAADQNTTGDVWALPYMRLRTFFLPSLHSHVFSVLVSILRQNNLSRLDLTVDVTQPACDTSRSEGADAAL